MSFIKSDLLRTASFFGLAGGAIGLANFFIAKLLELNPFPTGNDFPWFISSILLAGSLVGAMWYFRKVDNQNVMHLWQGLAIGFWVWIFFMLVECTGIFIYLKLDPAYLDQYLQSLADGLLKDKEQYLKEYKEADFNSFIIKIKTTSARQMVFDGFIKKSIFPAFISFVASLILRRLNRDAEGNLI